MQKQYLGYNHGWSNIYIYLLMDLVYLFLVVWYIKRGDVWLLSNIKYVEQYKPQNNKLRPYFAPDTCTLKEGY